MVMAQYQESICDSATGFVSEKGAHFTPGVKQESTLDQVANIRMPSCESEVPPTRPVEHENDRYLDSNYEAAKASFEVQYPEFCKTMAKFAHLRRSEFSNLNEQKCTYLDFTGAALPPQSLLEQHFSLLKNNLFGNPHSINEPSLRSTQHDEAARAAVLKFCNADPELYTVIWTANASAALKLVGQSYAFNKHGAFVYAPDCHNSVLGISEFAKRRGAAVRGFSFARNWKSTYDYDDLESVMDEMSVRRKARCMPAVFSRKQGGRLLAVPAQSNVSGVKHRVQRIVEAAHRRGWDVVLDTAALAPTSGLDLGVVQPEFACLSFYKLFGYPTGIGCLVAKKSALARMERPWFAGGTVRAVSAQPDHLAHLAHDKARAECWEDGTINFQQTSAVEMGLRWLREVNMEHVRVHTSSLVGWLTAELRSLRWGNGAPFCFIPEMEGEGGEQGSSVAMLVLSPQGRIVPHKVMEAKAVGAGFAVRTGCFCNPGTGFMMYGWFEGKAVAGEAFLEGFVRAAEEEGPADVYKALGFVRVSAGIPSSFADVYRLLSFLRLDILARPHELEAEAERFLREAGTPYSFC